MPLTKRGKLKKEKKLQDYREDLAKKTGIYFSPELNSLEKDSFPFLKYGVNALILFGGVYGALGCLISAFKLEVSMVPLAFTCIFFSLVLSFMYASRRAKIFTYLTVLVGVISMSFGLFVVINSGFSAIRNNILKYINNTSGLPFLREYTVYYKDEYTAMTMAFCVLAIGLMILINIVVSEKMSLRGIFYLTFPIAQFGMFFDYGVSKFYMVCLITSWLIVAITEFSDSYNGLTRKMVSGSSVKKHTHSYGFITDSHNVAKISMLWVSVFLCLSVLTFSLIPSDNFQVNLPTNKIKQSTERVVKNFLSYGMGSLWSEEKDSVEPGQLSNVGTVGFDNLTDLEVTLVNYMTDRVYLRNFVGYDYDGNHLRWYGFGGNDAKEQYGFTPEILKYDFEHNQILCKSKHKFKVTPTDKTKGIFSLNVPYYANVNGDNINFKSSGEAYEFNYGEMFTPKEYYAYSLDVSNADYSKLINEIEDSELKAEYENTLANIRKDAYYNALSVPDSAYEGVKKFCETYNIKPTDEDVVNKVLNTLEDNFEYTLRPGKVPYGEDYVNYFLNANMKGYCQHFATATTLILRYLGIPARYVEGYTIDREDFYTAESVKGEKLEDWITTPFKSDVEPVKVNVPDSSGHAWVEIYKEGIGWVNIEATTAPSAEGGGFLSNLFGRANGAGIANPIADRVKEINGEKTKQGMILFLIAVLSIFVFVYFSFVAAKIIKRIKKFNTQNPKLNINNRYASVYALWQFAFDEDNTYLSYKEFFDLLTEKKYSENNIFSDYEKIIFGGDSENSDMYELLNASLKTAEKNIYKNMQFIKKLKYCFLCKF